MIHRESRRSRVVCSTSFDSGSVARRAIARHRRVRRGSVLEAEGLHLRRQRLVADLQAIRGARRRRRWPRPAPAESPDARPRSTARFVIAGRLPRRSSAASGFSGRRERRSSFRLKMLAAESCRRRRESPRARGSSAARARCPATDTPRKRLERRRRQRQRRLAELAAFALDEVPRQHRNVLEAIAQRRNRDRKHRQPEIEILAKLPRATCCFSVRLVAATTRTSTLTLPVPPSRSKVRSSSARRILPCSASGSSPISSRKSVPRCASSNLPSLRWVAPVNAPFS